ncbi:STAS domain-containing protein [bacterium]|nr:STAS domain-containing protein [bacterium]
MSVWEKLEWETIFPENKGVILLRLSGALGGSRESYALLDEVRDNLRGDHKKIVFNLENVERMTSAGVGILCAIFTSIANTDGKMYLVGVTERNKTLLDIVGLWDQLAHFSSESDVQFD